MTAPSPVLDEILWPDTPFDLQPHLALVARVGSHSHGTYIPPEDPNSIDDQDIIGVVIPPEKYYVGLSRWENASSIKECWDVTLYEYRRVVALLIKQNPNVLGLLWLDDEDYLYVTPAWQILIDHRDLFRDRHYAFNAFLGYATSQIKKMEGSAFKGYMGEKRKRLVKRFGYDVKNASHLIRLLNMGIEYLFTGQLRVRRDEDRDLLVEIKRGGWPLSRVQRYAAEREAKLRAVYESSTLPDESNFDAIEELVTEALFPVLQSRRPSCEVSQ